MKDKRIVRADEAKVGQTVHFTHYPGCDYTIQRIDRTWTGKVRHYHREGETKHPPNVLLWISDPDAEAQ